MDDYERFDQAVDRAYAEVFGSDGDSQMLRDLLVQTMRTATSMPRAQAALFALRDLSAPIADAVLERARLYYAGGSTGCGKRRSLRVSSQPARAFPTASPTSPRCRG